MTTRTPDTRYPLATALFLASTTHYLCLMAFGYVGPLSTIEQVATGALAFAHAMGVVVLVLTWWMQRKLRREVKRRAEVVLGNMGLKGWKVTVTKAEVAPLEDATHVPVRPTVDDGLGGGRPVN